MFALGENRNRDTYKVRPPVAATTGTRPAVVSSHTSPEPVGGTAVAWYDPICCHDEFQKFELADRAWPLYFVGANNC